MQSIQTLQNEIVHFTRDRDYKLLKELGQGACGKTVLLYDDVIDEHFVCKKYVPYAESERQTLFTNFVREIKLMHRLHHPNIVRLYSYFLYPERLAGYILMEFVDGSNIEEFIQDTPEKVTELFVQCVNGFAYLEQCGVLHRDIRPENLLVDDAGRLKIIDLGFGKRINTSLDFDKSITLNWWCQTPADFENGTYDFTTEVYFVGKLFEQLIQENKVTTFRFPELLREMCSHRREFRTAKFADVQRRLRTNQFAQVQFGEKHKMAYRAFADSVISKITQIDSKASYVEDADKILQKLESAYRAVMLEDLVPDSSLILSCLLTGTYSFRRGNNISVSVVANFIKLLKEAGPELSKIIVANLHTRLDAVVRYIQDEDIPF